LRPSLPPGLRSPSGRPDNEHTLSGLLKKRAEIAGQIEHKQDELRQLVIALHAPARFDPSIELQEISKRPVPPCHHAFKGEVTRDRAHHPQERETAPDELEIAQRVMAEGGLDSANVRL
jgi:hypothetical protein